MGFGLLLAGYFTLTFLSFAVGDYAFAFYAVGGAVSFIAAGKLYEYKHRFGITVATSLGWIALGVYGAVAFLGEVFLWELPLPGMDATVPNLVLFLLQLVHTAGLLSATDCLARQVGAEKVKSAIPWDAGILGTWAVGQVVLLLFPAVAAFEDQTVTKIVLLIQLIGYLMVCLTLLRAYRLICPAGEEENAPRKRSRSDQPHQRQVGGAFQAGIGGKHGVPPSAGGIPPHAPERKKKKVEVSRKPVAGSGDRERRCAYEKEQTRWRVGTRLYRGGCGVPV